MAAKISETTHVQHIQHERFTTKQHGYRLWHLSLDLSGNIAVSGFHDSSGRTHIDLYSGKDSDSRDKLKLFYSKEFENYLGYRHYRFVSFLDKNVSKLVTCIADKIEIIVTKNKSKVLRSCKVNGKIITCLAVREGEIFIGLLGSPTVLVFNNDLKETKKIKIKGIEDGDYPRDLQVIKDTVFVCTVYGRALSLSVYDGSTVSKYTDTTAMYSNAHSIAVSEEMNLVAVLWLGSRKRGIIVYSLNKNESFLVYDVDSDVTRIRISSRDRKIITGNEETGEIKMYDLEQLFSFEAMKRTLACLLSPDQCEELKKYFGVAQEEMRRLEAVDEDASKKLSDGEKRVKRMERLLTIIEKKGHTTPYNINTLTDAVSTLGDESHISQLKGPMEGYSLHNKNMKQTISVAEMMTRQKSWEDERNQLISKLETAESKVEKHVKTLDDLQGELVHLRGEAQQWKEDQSNAVLIKEKLTEELKSKCSKEVDLLTSELSQTKQELLTRTKELGTTNMDLHTARTELKQYELDFAKESKALKEVLSQAKDVIAELQKRPFESRPVDDSDKTVGINEGEAILAAEFGRLTVAVAEYLTLGDCLHLAKVCDIPTSDYDMVYRVGLSYNESPGMKLLDVLKKRKVINMFDVTNLQKALAMLQLEAVNHNIVAPYQKKIGEEQHELHKTEEMFTWEDVNKYVSKVKLTPQQTSKEAPPNDGSEPECTSQKEVRSEAGEDRGSLIIDRPLHLLYAEQSVGREGGIIRLTNVSLTVPPDALHENHVIAISVMNESPFPLDREVDTARMTPLIKLEPLGLTFKKPVQLNIPHSALISEPENHDVIIHSGQLSKTDDNSSDLIRWTEEKSILRQLKDKSVTVDIQCLTFLSARLASQTSAPSLHIVRAVPFVDRVRNAVDDVILTICFCSDNDSEYNMLLSDYKTKLPLEQYSTLQLHRHSARDGDDVGFLSVTVTAVNNTYIPDKEQAMKKFAVSHLCTASRVSHQIRLKKDQETDRDVVDILLTFTQAEYEPSQISLKARIKDLIISEESEKLVFGPISPGNKMYEDMLFSVSSSLDGEQCKELAAHFHLNSKDLEMITPNEDPGMMLMKTLEEKSLIDPQKMIHLFEGLKACHLHETTKLVTEYICKIPKSTPEEGQKPEPEKITDAAMEKSFQELVCKGMNSLIGTLVWIWQVYSDYPLT